MPELLEGAREAIEEVLRTLRGQKQDQLSRRVEEALSRYLYGETGRRPMVYVVIT